MVTSFAVAVVAAAVVSVDPAFVVVAVVLPVVEVPQPVKIEIAMDAIRANEMIFFLFIKIPPKTVYI